MTSVIEGRRVSFAISSTLGRLSAITPMMAKTPTKPQQAATPPQKATRFHKGRCALIVFLRVARFAAGLLAVAFFDGGLLVEVFFTALLRAGGRLAVVLDRADLLPLFLPLPVMD